MKRNTVSLTDEAAGWVSEWRKLGEHRQLRLITACVLACGENSTVIHLLRSLRAATEPESQPIPNETKVGNSSAAAEPEAKAPVCDHGRPPTRMVPCLKVDGAWACETCGSQCYDPENPRKAARPEAKCMGMIPGTAFMCGEMAGYYCPNCRREDDR